MQQQDTPLLGSCTNTQLNHPQGLGAPHHSTSSSRLLAQVLPHKTPSWTHTVPGEMSPSLHSVPSRKASSSWHQRHAEVLPHKTPLIELTIVPCGEGAVTITASSQSAVQQTQRPWHQRCSTTIHACCNCSKPLHTSYSASSAALYRL